MLVRSNNGRSTRNPEPSDHRATYVGLRGAAGVAALTAAAPLASVPTTTVTVQQARSAIGLPRSSKENDKQLKVILSTVAGGQLRPAVAQPCRWRAPRPRRCVDRCRGCHRFTSVDSWMRQRGRRLDPWRATAPQGPCPYYSAANAVHPTAEARASAVLSGLRLVLRIPVYAVYAVSLPQLHTSDP